MKKTLILIGGGEIRQKQTLEIDRYAANIAKERTPADRRSLALFVGTASHDSLPYYNSFHKTYTGELGMKTDVALSFKGTMDAEKTANKFKNADLIYVGGGDTAFMLETWRDNGFDKYIIEAYERGAVVVGLSAGAICWFEKMYTDSKIIEGASAEYEIMDALGFLKGTACPHYDERRIDFDKQVESGNVTDAIAIENGAAAVYEDGEFAKAVSSFGTVYAIQNKGGKVVKTDLCSGEGDL